MAGQNIYMECYSGASGDMIVAALLDLGADKEVLLSGLKSLNISGYRIEISRLKKNSTEACDFNVIMEETSFDIPERNLFDIYKIIDYSLISENAKDISKKIFKIKAEALAHAHKTNIENIYFHERGAVDSIVDIVSAAVCLDNLNIDDVILSDIYDGCGTVECRSGIIPVLVPAVVSIADRYKLNLKATNIRGEMVTPTGASILAGIRTKKDLPENHEIRRVGIGAGKRIYPNEGVLRIYLF
jgi:uncharacterized protein (DUF111 family)